MDELPAQRFQIVAGRAEQTLQTLQFARAVVGADGKFVGKISAGDVVSFQADHTGKIKIKFKTSDGDKEGFFPKSSVALSVDGEGGVCFEIELERGQALDVFGDAIATDSVLADDRSSRGTTTRSAPELYSAAGNA